MVVGFPNFWKLDCNDEWVESCGALNAAKIIILEKTLSCSLAPAMT